MIYPEIKPRTIRAFIAGVEILAEYMRHGKDSQYQIGGEHDMVHFFVEVDILPPDSPHGQYLQELGFCPTDADNWGWST